MRTFTEFILKKGTTAFIVLCCLSVVFHIGCGGYGSGSGSKKPPVSKLAKRAFVTVTNPTTLSNTMLIMDASKDQFTAFSIPLFGSHATLTQPGANNTTLVFSSSENGISIVDNATETVKNANDIQLPGTTESMVETSDGKTIYAAVRSTSQVSVVDVANEKVSANITVPSVRRVVLSHNNSKLLAFSDNTNSLAVINAADNTVTTVSGFDRPFFAAFSTDDTKAYVLNCGPECGGNTASITMLDMTASTPGAGANLPVSAATTALLDSGNLYVAGTDKNGTGHLDTVNLSSFTVSKSVVIGNGFHSLLTLASNNKLFVGAQSCTTGCLSIVDISAGTAVIDNPAGDVSGIAPISGRNVMYVTEGGELRIFDTTTSKPQANQLDIVGTAAGVVAP